MSTTKTKVISKKPPLLIAQDTQHKLEVAFSYLERNYSVGIRAKQSGTVKNVGHSKNDCHERSKQVPKDWHSGDFDAKWQEKELHK